MAGRQTVTHSRKVRLAVSVLSVLVLLVLLLSQAKEQWTEVQTQSRKLSEGVPEGILALQLASSGSDATQVLRLWHARPSPDAEGQTLLDVAETSLPFDMAFIACYVGVLLAMVALFSFAFKLEPRLKGCVLGLGFTALLAGATDSAENGLLLLAIDHYRDSDVISDSWVAWVRFFAVTKFIALALSPLLIVVGLFAALRSWWIKPKESKIERGTFYALHQREATAIGKGTLSDEKQAMADGGAGEPLVRQPAGDYVGLAFSGGGIRSATFNLGLLQGLHSFGLLGLFDYLSTVSGGGYIGAFWTRWRLQNRLLEFPDKRSPGAPRPEAWNSEADEIRHLREFSMFLSPRWGFFETEMWNAVMAVVSGMLPTLLLAFCLVANGVLAFFALTGYLAFPSRCVGIVWLIVITIVIMFSCEKLWERGKKGRKDAKTRAAVAVFTVLSLVLIVFLWLTWCEVLQQLSNGSEWPMLVGGKFAVLAQPGTSDAWWSLAGLRAPEAGVFFSPRLFDFGVVWLATALVMALGRCVIPSLASLDFQRCVLPAFDRVLQRLFAAGLVWCAAALIWHLGVDLATNPWQISATAGTAAGSAGIFALLRNWLGKAVQEAEQRGWLDKLKPKVPQVLAYFTVVLAAIAVAGALAYALSDQGWRWYGFACGTWLILGLSLFLDPTEVALHSFYRHRLARAYLGATNPNYSTASANRYTDLMSGDDLSLVELLDDTKKPRRPLHLVCCAGNDLAGDHLANLGRGSRSAVLSCHGLAIGNHWAERPGVMFASAMTASAAAFNSQMGSVSRHLGPAVTFLMSALNLRLGLWMRHPAVDSQRDNLFPGLLLWREFVGDTRCGLVEIQGKMQPTAEDVHLSDGGHFENLGLYELVRRHCRYIIVSDCGADPEYTFVDFGNAVRRIREDFNIEIEIDVNPLRPDEKGLAKQHMVAGTIHYDDSSDKGILLLFKPNRTGDEPTDVSQYAAENERFPQETTIDQFYDESQWEAYRRLGGHALRSGLRFLEKLPSQKDRKAQVVFSEARWAWYAKPPGYEDRFLEFTQRCAEIDSLVSMKGPPTLIAQVYPEWYRVAHPKGTAPELNPDGHLNSLHILLQVGQLMEDVWLACSLDDYFNHPMNLGWMNYFQRWAYAPIFRAWWPVLRPIYSPGFRRFAAEHWKLDVSLEEPQISLDCTPDVVPGGLAQEWWQNRVQSMPSSTSGKHVFSYTIHLHDPHGRIASPDADTTSLQCALAIVSMDMKTKVASWRSDHLFVPPTLWASGIGSAFLRAMLEELAGKLGVKECHVTLSDGRKKTDLGTRQERIDMLEFYKSNGFSPGSSADVLTWKPLQEAGIRFPNGATISFSPRFIRKTISADDRCYVLLYTPDQTLPENVYCYDSSGKEIWQVQQRDPATKTEYYRMRLSDGKLMCFGVDGCRVAVHLDSGMVA